VVIDLALSTAIPDDYIPSRQRKLETYRRIAELREIDDLAALRDELRDRYGPPPEPVRNLLYGVEVKLRALRAGAVDVRARGPEIRVTLGADISEPQKRAVRQAFPRAQLGQRQIKVGILEIRGDRRDALTRLLELLRQ
jgi:transcription-repair coupling factor (superfamily II helicase)